MYTSKLYFPTLKESPSEAELTSHKLMLRAGLIHKLASGLYTWLPLGLKVLQKVEAIVREEMNAIDAQEMLMPNIQPSELWQETGRWDLYGPMLLKMQDRHKREFCFGPTHEEVITNLTRNQLRSYKQLPLCLYQIQTKFRDEIRPRFGLMRAREFLMKDAYSFHLNDECLEKTYDAMHQAYTNILNRLNLKFRSVMADSGEIGGSKSQEFHVLADSGEDSIVYAKNGKYAANMELAVAKPKSYSKENPTELTKTSTPNITSVAEQAEFMGIPQYKILKTLLVKGKTEEHPVVALLLVGSDTLNNVLAAKHELVASPLTLVTNDEVQRVAKCKPGFVGPIGLEIPLIADRHAVELQNFSCGANIDDYHYIGVDWERDIPKPIVSDLRIVKAGDSSLDDTGELDILRGIEVGHIFMLGDKYSKAMQATVLNDKGKAVNYVMGCYGMGVSRMVAASIEQNHDDNGIIWPRALTPFQLVIVPLDYHKIDDIKSKADALYKQLKDAGIDVLLEDRKERPGVMFKDLDLIGIPYRVVLSKKTLADAKLEFKPRGEDASLLDIDSAFDEILKMLRG